MPQLALERDGGGILLRRYHHGADLISMSAPTSLYYFHHDDLGSAMNVTSATGVKQWTYTYEPYGLMKTIVGASRSARSDLQRRVGELTGGQRRATMWLPVATQIGVRELRNSLTAALRRVESGERIEVTRDGTPVAVIAPYEPRPIDRLVAEGRATRGRPFRPRVPTVVWPLERSSTEIITEGRGDRF